MTELLKQADELRAHYEQNGNLQPAAILEALAEELRGKECKEHVIIYEDPSIKPELITGHAEAIKLLKLRAENWECHLFQRINGSADLYKATLPQPKQED